MASMAAGRPGASLIEGAARQVIYAGLRDGDSAFTPGVKVWTSANADELDRCYVQRPDAGGGSFIEKLQLQLADAEPTAVQLMAELLYLNVLPLMNVKGKTKRVRINTVLSWHPEKIELPSSLDHALDFGVFRGGVGFNTMLWTQVVHLVAFVRAWWAQDEASRSAALQNPWRFKDFLDSVGGGSAPAQRNELKYLAFPNTFQPIVNADHRLDIRQGFVDLLDGRPGDIDRDLFTIHQKLQEASPDKPVDFYVEPWVSSWQKKPPPTETQKAWLVRPLTDNPEQVLELWTGEGFVSLPAEGFGRLSPGVSIETVRDAVALAQPALNTNERADRAADVHAFLSRIAVGDLIACNSEGRLFLGVVAAAPPTFTGGPDGKGVLRREVTWSTPYELPALADVPPSIAAKLKASTAVSDISGALDRLHDILSDERNRSLARSQVFVSYSHDDSEWLARLTAHLRPLVRTGQVEVWSDTQIKSGALWKAEIAEALDRAKAAVLLITASFLASDFVQTVELPKLLAAAAAGGCRVIPVIVSPSVILHVPELARFQTVNPPSRPLTGMSRHEQEETLVKVAVTLLELPST